MATLYALTGDFLTLQDMMLDPDMDTQTILDTLEGLEGEIEVKLDNCVTAKKSLESHSEMIDKEIKRLQKWKKTIDNNAGNLTNYMLRSMLAIGKDKIETEFNRFTVKTNAPTLEIDDESLVPDKYKIPLPSKIDRTNLLKFLKTLPEDKTVPYAHIVKDKKSLLIK